MILWWKRDVWYAFWAEILRKMRFSNIFWEYLTHPDEKLWQLEIFLVKIWQKIVKFNIFSHVSTKNYTFNDNFLSKQVKKFRKTLGTSFCYNFISKYALMTYSNIIFKHLLEMSMLITPKKLINSILVNFLFIISTFLHESHHPSTSSSFFLWPTTMIINGFWKTNIPYTHTHTPCRCRWWW